MNRRKTALLTFLFLLTGGGMVLALSIELPAPQIRYPRGFDAGTAAAVQAVLGDKQFHYAHGLYSHWPPKWSTTLVYEGDAASLQRMLDGLARVPGMRVRVVFAKDLAQETAEKRPDGDWWVEYSRETPQTITVKVDLASKSIDLSKLELNVAPAAEAKP